MTTYDKEQHLEILGATNSDLVLQTDAVKCKVCGLGDVKPVKSEKESASFMIYTRDGTLIGTHIESRCNNRTLPCRAGHYHGYVTMGESGNPDKPKCYAEFALKNKS